MTGIQHRDHIMTGIQHLNPASKHVHKHTCSIEAIMQCLGQNPCCHNNTYTWFQFGERPQAAVHL